jgi:Probable Zinc-ribbon domain
MSKHLTESPLHAEWHPTKNAGSELSTVKQGSGLTVWWLGQCGHEWEARVANRVNGSGCPYCSNQKVLTGFNDLAFARPELAAEWHLTKNGTVLASEVISGTAKKAWWLGECGHEWEASVSSRSGKQNVGCPFCSNVRTLKGFNDFESEHPELAAEWHPTKNTAFLPDMLTSGSPKKVWWLCPEGHEWEAKVVSRVSQHVACPVCSNLKLLSGFNDLATVNPAAVSEWHPTKNEGLPPSDVIYSSDRRVWWLCENEHEWEAPVKSRMKETGVYCPVCQRAANNSVRISRIIQQDGSLRDNYPVLAGEWNYEKNDGLSPERFTGSSNKVVWWICSEGHEWDAVTANRTTKSSGCPHCAKSFSRKEAALFSYVSTLGFPVIQSDRTVLHPKELDMYIPEKNLAIEFNGVFWHSEEQGKDQFYHYNKWLGCKEQGIQLLQVWEDDWDRNPELIKRMVAHKLGVSSEPKISGRKTVFKEVSTSEAKTFLNENHLQGYATAKYFGLFFEENLVALIGFRYFEADARLEITRFAVNSQVIGGFSKLLKNSLSFYPEAQVVHSYSHNDHATGSMYEISGFVKKHEGKPGYSYVVNKAVRVNRLNFTKAKFDSRDDLEFKEGLSERELAALNGLTRTWDSGSSLWVKSLS